MRASVLVVLGLCACAVQGPRARALHEVDGELVYSNPPSAAAYEAYLRARVALNAEPPQLDMARAEIELAIRYDGRAPHLWTTRAEIAALAGDEETAAAHNFLRQENALWQTGQIFSGRFCLRCIRRVWPALPTAARMQV